MAKALGEQGVIPPWAVEEIERLSTPAHLDAAAIREVTQDTRHIISGMIKAFRAMAGEAGEFYHLGSTTQDVLDTSLALLCRDSLAIVWRDVWKLVDALLESARLHAGAIQAGRSQGQQGLPVTFGFKTAIWAEQIGYHLERLDQLRPRILVASMSAAMGTQASFTLLLGADGARRYAQRVSELLGLDCPRIDPHRMVERFAELTNGLALLMGTLGQMGLELKDLMRNEIAEVRETWRDATDGSSTMPHKRNPEPAHWLEGLAKVVRGNAVAMMDMQMAHERDATRTAAEFAGLPESFLAVSRALVTARDIVENLEIDRERMRANLDCTRGMAMSEAVMLTLARKMGRRQEAYGIVKECSARVWDQNLDFYQVLNTDARVRKHLDSETLSRLLNPECYLGTLDRQIEAVLENMGNRRTRLRGYTLSER